MGRPEHQKVTQISANPSKRVRLINLDFYTAIPSGSTNEIQIFSPAGYLSTVQNMRIRFPIVTSATSGDKTLQVFVASIIGVTMGQSAYNTHTEYVWRHWGGSLSAELPADESGQVGILSGLVFDQFNGLKIVYSNNTNAASSTSELKNCQLWVLDEKIT